MRLAQQGQGSTLGDSTLLGGSPAQDAGGIGEVSLYLRPHLLYWGALNRGYLIGANAAVYHQGYGAKHLHQLKVIVGAQKSRLGQYAVFPVKVNLIFVLKDVIGAGNAGIVPAEKAAQLVVYTTMGHVVDLVQALGIGYTLAAGNGIVGGNLAQPQAQVGGLQQVIGAYQGQLIIFRRVEEGVGILCIGRVDVGKFTAYRQGQAGQ
ncbi:hypothetical protein ADICEAN_03229 [Cesiribacter andamanensis AMV16]|uniref:Uncharacterized protein n=1 Tax=Cesiribacter andamanensis AMV16 TaxID=1279009 RepID=M7MYU5_9BACT|nr:hypothetical protein ADICEAN_03229 [Cesiribacter andamanensis AMV16]